MQGADGRRKVPDARSKETKRESSNNMGRYRWYPRFFQRYLGRLGYTWGQNRVSRTDNQLKSILQDLVKETNDVTLISFEVENRLPRKIRDVISLQSQLTRMTEAILDNHDFFGTVRTTVKKKTEKAGHVQSKREY